MNYAKEVQEKDPDVFKNFKHLVDERPMRVVNNAKEPDDMGDYGCGVGPDMPVVAPKLHYTSRYSGY